MSDSTEPLAKDLSSGDQQEHHLHQQPRLKISVEPSPINTKVKSSFPTGCPLESSNRSNQAKAPSNPPTPSLASSFFQDQKRVWVQRLGSVPTSVFVGPNDLIGMSLAFLKSLLEFYFFFF